MMSAHDCVPSYKGHVYKPQVVHANDTGRGIP